MSDTLGLMRLRQLSKRVLDRRQIEWSKRRLASFAAHDLDRLARLYGTDKGSRSHGYTVHYERHLRAQRTGVTRVLEIGIGGYARGVGGSSLRMWRTYFPKATVVGLDLYEKDLREPRIVTVQGDQSDPDVLLGLAADWGPFDLIVDDGSHQNSHVVLAVTTLFDAVKPGGIYIIEDVETAYRDSAGGGPPGAAGTSIGFVKTLVDALQADHFPDPNYREGLPDLPVASLHVYPNMVLLQKSTAAPEPEAGVLGDPVSPVSPPTTG